MDKDTLPVDWETCEHQTEDFGHWESGPFNFCPWCGKDLRKEKSNEPSSKTIDR